MGLKTKTTNVVYLTISKDELATRVKEATETSVSRILEKGNNAGNTIHEEKYGSVEGRLIGLYRKESKVSFQPHPLETLEIILQDEDGLNFQLSMNFSSSHTKSFITRVENLDLDKDFEITPYWIKGDDDKFRGYVGLKQYGDKVNPRYSKDLKNIPEVKQVRVGKNTHYDDEELLAFYVAIIDKLQDDLKIHAPKAERIPADDEQPENTTEDSEDGNKKEF